MKSNSNAVGHSDEAILTQAERAQEATRLEAQGLVTQLFGKDLETLRSELEPAASELAREMGVRERCFPRWVEQGKISRIDAKDRFLRHKKAVEIMAFLLDIVGGEVHMSTDDVPF